MAADCEHVSIRMVRYEKIECECDCDMSLGPVDIRYEGRFGKIGHSKGFQNQICALLGQWFPSKSRSKSVPLWKSRCQYLICITHGNDHVIVELITWSLFVDSMFIPTAVIL